MFVYWENYLVDRRDIEIIHKYLLDSFDWADWSSFVE